MTEVARRMQVWLFQFTEDPRPCASVRVAAWDRTGAVSLLASKLARVMDPSPYQHPLPGCILSCIGRNDNITEPQIIQYVGLDGKVEVA